MKIKIIGNIWLDSVLATAFIFLVIYALSSLLSSLEAIDPIGEALEDVEFTDLVYSNLREPPPAEDDIVLVNVANLPRAGIAEQIRIINKYDPKVIGLDLIFPFPKDPVQDSILVNTLSKVDHLVMASKLLNYQEDGDYFDSVKVSADPFRLNADFAFANLVTDEGVMQEDVKTCRTFTPQLKYKDQVQMSFAVNLANHYAPEKVQKFLQRDRGEEFINFKGNIIGSESNFATTFYALDVKDVFNENFLPELITDKIVIFGYMGDYFGDPYSTEDKYFTPLNVKYAGRGAPDMYGSVIHANIISMILDEDYVYKLSARLQLLIAVILCYINVVAFMWIYYRLPKWYDGITKITQLLELLFIIGIIIYAYHWFDWVLELTLAMGVVAAVGDSLEVYNGVVKNMFTKEGRKELFSVSKKTKKVVIN